MTFVHFDYLIIFAYFTFLLDMQINKVAPSFRAM